MCPAQSRPISIACRSKTLGVSSASTATSSMPHHLCARLSTPSAGPTLLVPASALLAIWAMCCSRGRASTPPLIESPWPTVTPIIKTASAHSAYTAIISRTECALPYPSSAAVTTGQLADAPAATRSTSTCRGGSACSCYGLWRGAVGTRVPTAHSAHSRIT